jgi:prepilin-type N-terminal cleavage/methylation domain-containing protein
MAVKKTGFSMVELIIVVAIVAIMAMMAGPALARLLPVQRLRGETQNMAAFMRQARLKAANDQKPVRVSLECPAPPRPSNLSCQLNMEAAIYVQGSVAGWNRVPTSGHELTRQVFASPSVAPLTGDGKTTPDNVYWIIFMPNGRAFSWPRPFMLDFHADDLRGAAGPGWRLAVSNESGRAIVNPIQKP